MNVFEQLSIAKEIKISTGKIVLDQQRIILFPINFISLYLLKIRDNPEQSRELYKLVKAGMARWAIPLGKDYALTYKDFLDRWVKYTAFGGWGITKYLLIDKDNNYGYLDIRNLSMHNYLKIKGIKEIPGDIIFEALVAGSISSTFKVDLDVIETECVCEGSKRCVFYWGPIKYLKNKFPDIISKRFGDIK